MQPSASMLLLVALLARGIAAEPVKKPTLESYLARLGYEPIPLQRDASNHLKVQAQLAGKQRAFCIDTGWSVTALNHGDASRLQTLGNLGVTLEDSFLGRLTDPTIVLMNLQLGRATFTNQPAEVTTMQAGGNSIADGVLGCDFLFRNHCIIDCQGNRLFVRGSAPPNAAATALDETLRRSGYLRSPLARAQSLVLTVEATVNDLPVRLLVDTGAVYSILDTSQTKRLKLRSSTTAEAVVGVGRHGSATLKVAVLKSFQVGDLALRNIRFGVADLRQWGIRNSRRSREDLHGILGGDQLILNNALIDCHGLILWMQPQR